MHADCDGYSPKAKQHAQKYGSWKSKQKGGQLEGKSFRIKNVTMSGRKNQTHDRRRDDDSNGLFLNDLAEPIEQGREQ